MNKALIAIALTLASQRAGAALQYEFRQVTNSQVDSIDSTDFTGRAIIEGDHCRVDFVGGNAYSQGTYMISTNGSRALTYVDPSKKSYLEINGEGVASAIGSNKITVANFKHDVQEVDDHLIVAGIDTEHYRVHISYDLTVTFGSIPLTQTVKTTIDKWTTTKFGDINGTFLASGSIHTGNPEIDQIIDVETTKVKGFALKESVQISTINNMAQPSDSLIKLDRTRTQTREMVITSIREAPVAPSFFLVPAGYHKSNPMQDDTQKAPVQTLSMDPAGN